LASPGNG